MKHRHTTVLAMMGRCLKTKFNHGTFSTGSDIITTAINSHVDYEIGGLNGNYKVNELKCCYIFWDTSP
jgi:hypothetical protein